MIRTSGGITVNRTFTAILMLLVFALASFTACISNTESSNVPIIDSTLFNDKTYETIIPNPDLIKTFQSKLGEPVDETIRDEEVWTRLGIYSNEGIEYSTTLPEWTLEPRDNIRMLIIEGETSITYAREKIMEIEGLITREYIWPSGLVVQGTDSMLEMVSQEEWVSSAHNVPIAMV